MAAWANLSKAAKVRRGRCSLRFTPVLVEKIEQHFSAEGMPPFGWYDVLWGLERAAGHRLRMHELAEMTVISRSNLTRLVDRLEAAGLVARERAEEDRRGAFAVLTVQGRAMRKKMWPVYAAAIKRSLRGSCQRAGCRADRQGDAPHSRRRARGKAAWLAGIVRSAQYPPAFRSAAASRFSCRPAGCSAGRTSAAGSAFRMRSMGRPIQRQIAQPIGMSPMVSASPAMYVRFFRCASRYPRISAVLQPRLFHRLRRRADRRACAPGSRTAAGKSARTSCSASPSTCRPRRGP